MGHKTEVRGIYTR
ncbi:unnamed protein product, partial [Adineta steineri]